MPDFQFKQDTRTVSTNSQSISRFVSPSARRSHFRILPSFITSPWGRNKKSGGSIKAEKTTKTTFFQTDSFPSFGRQTWLVLVSFFQAHHQERAQIISGRRRRVCGPRQICPEKKDLGRVSPSTGLVFFFFLATYFLARNHLESKASEGIPQAEPIVASSLVSQHCLFLISLAPLGFFSPCCGNTLNLPLPHHTAY